MARVLVAEDEAPIRWLLAEVLEGEGHIVLAVASGTEALARAAEQAPDLAVLDLNLPGLDGESVAMRLRGLYGDAVPVVLVSASPYLALAARHVGAAGYMAKPFDLDTFIALTDGLVPI
jgi:two-component system KDP operon response regulator KdpE